MIRQTPSCAGPSFRRALLSILLPLALIGCPAGDGRDGRTFFLDEAFSALLPGLASQIGAASIKAQDLSPAIKKSLSSSRGRSRTQPQPLLASPLAARRIAEEAAILGLASEEAMPPAVVFFSGSLLDLHPWIWNVEYDFEGAYASMGEKAVGESDPGAKIGILFQENFMRGSDALKAFERAVEAARGPGAVEVAIMEADPTQIDMSGRAEQALDKLAAAKPHVLVLAVDDAWAAWLLAREARAKLGTGIKALYADQTSWTLAGIGSRETFPRGEGPGEAPFSFRIEADQKRLARAAQGVLRSLETGRKVPKTTKVPLRLLH
ncbi:MAG: hypothetical protein FD137_1364 [Spirochaetes bacterium]|nr:MAG: hypothetical protein FD137_1364 [Spirochaetota bacterium]